MYIWSIIWKIFFHFHDLWRIDFNVHAALWCKLSHYGPKPANLRQLMIDFLPFLFITSTSQEHDRKPQQHLTSCIAKLFLSCDRCGEKPFTSNNFSDQFCKLPLQNDWFPKISPHVMPKTRPCIFSDPLSRVIQVAWVSLPISSRMPETLSSDKAGS